MEPIHSNNVYVYVLFLVCAWYLVGCILASSCTGTGYLLQSVEESALACYVQLSSSQKYGFFLAIVKSFE